MIRSRLKRTPFQNAPKVCKGTGIAKGSGCGLPAMNRIYGLGKNCGCYSVWLLSTTAGQAKMKAAILKVTKPRIDSEISLNKAFDEKNNRFKLNNIFIAVKQLCHEYVRKRDAGRPCISCGGHWDPSHEAGHFYKSELYSTLRFDENNIHGQCIGCNRFKDGAESNYRVGLLNRYGKEYLEELDHKAQAERQGSHKWDREELEKIRTYYKQKIKELPVH